MMMMMTDAKLWWWWWLQCWSVLMRRVFQRSCLKSNLETPLHLPLRSILPSTVFPFIIFTIAKKWQIHLHTRSEKYSLRIWKIQCSILHFANFWYVLSKALSGLLLSCQSICSQYCFMLPICYHILTLRISKRKCTSNIFPSEALCWVLRLFWPIKMLPFVNVLMSKLDPRWCIWWLLSNRFPPRCSLLSCQFSPQQFEKTSGSKTEDFLENFQMGRG